jgi:radical SAM protein with 4Fe4S-binding SPASM domain
VILINSNDKKRIIDFINITRQKIPFVSISTNALLLDDEMVNNLYSSNLSELTLALDSLNKETYEGLRVGSNFERVKKNIDNALVKRVLFKSECKVELQVIVTNKNAKEIPLYKKQYGWLNETEWGKLRIKEFSTFAGNVDNMSPGEIERRNSNCPKLFNSIAVHWNGDITICCRCYDSYPILGNVHTHNINEVFNSNKYNEMRENMKNKNFINELSFCKEC